MTGDPKYPSLEESYNYIHHSSLYRPSRPHDTAYEPSSSRRLQIPDFRFEQNYLKRIQQCIHIQPVAQKAKEKEVEHHVTADEGDSEFTSATYTTPLINPSQQVVRIDWGKIVYITLRDQVMMPLLQGMVWGIVGTFYKPVVSYAKTWLWVHLVPAFVREGTVAVWPQSWVKKMGLGSITIGTPSFSIRTPST